MQANAMRDVSERSIRFGDDRWINSQEAGNEQSNISMNNQGFPQASTGQPSDQLRYASSGRDDDGVSALTADEVSTATVHEPERLGIPTRAQTCRSASQTPPVGEQNKVSQDSAEKRVAIQTAARHQPYFREWKWEILSVVVSFGLLVGILVTLAKYNGNEQPVWPYNININSLVSVLTALITAQLGVITSGIISQLKWSWFRRPHPLRDLDHYDEASRGIWGSLSFLGRFISQPGAYLAMGASFLFLISAAIGPFAQQSIKTYACQRPLHNVSASIPAAVFINSSLDVGAENPFNRLPNLQMMIAILEGLISTSGNSTQVSVDCPTGDCDFDPYRSLAYCSSCEDITPKVQEQHWMDDDMGEYLWNYLIPGQECQLSFRDLRGHPLVGTQSATGSSPIHLTTCLGDMDYRHKSAFNYTILSMSWANCTDDSKDALPDNGSCAGYPEQLPSLANTSGLVAMNCTLNLCVRDYVAHVHNGLLEESTTATFAASLYPNDEGSNIFKLLPLPCAIDGQSYDLANLSQVPIIPGRNFTSVILEDGQNVTAPLECVFSVYESLPWAVNQFLEAEVLADSVGVGSGVSCSKDSLGGFSTCEPWYLAPIFNDGKATAESITVVMESIADSVSSRMRMTGSNAYDNGTGYALGTVTSTTVCLRIEWPWLILPVALVLLTMVLFIVILSMARHFLVTEGMPIWKSSAVIPFFHGFVRKQGDENVTGSSYRSDSEVGGRAIPQPLGQVGFGDTLLRLDHIKAEAARIAVRLETAGAGQQGFVVVEQEGQSSAKHLRKRHFFRHASHKAEAYLLNWGHTMDQSPALPDVELGNQLVPSIWESLHGSHQQ